jgi:archaemetzincin
MVQDLLIRLKKVNPNIALRNPIAFPINAYYEPRNRYKADSLIYFLKQITIKGHVAIGLTNKDISSSMPGYEDWGVMGLSYMPGKACIVSSFRLNKNNISDQLFKVAIHELGHTQGLHHCATITCLMRDAEGKNTTDQEKEFCPKCKSLLISKGWMIN